MNDTNKLNLVMFLNKLGIKSAIYRPYWIQIAFMGTSMNVITSQEAREMMGIK